MNIFSTKLRPTAALMLAAATLLVLGCSQKPEDAGKDIAELRCKCETANDDAEYKRDETLLAELQSNKFASHEKFYSRLRELNRSIHREDSTCDAKLRTLSTKVEINFPQETDRQTITNAGMANYKQCRMEREAETKDRKRINYYDLAGKLPSVPTDEVQQ